MPMYEYLCNACGHTLDALQKITDEPLKECPACHQDTLQKLVSLSSFQLKGTGWYETDHKTKKPQSDSKSSEASSSKTETEKAPASTESKPAAAPTTDTKTDK